ncbi:MAG TPA: hypothetical protein VES67_11615 [Vicinamibacterales bacterium]|nr:hypothetical protein [Vicinamibacterales bacterium]
MTGYRWVAIVSFALIAEACATGRFGPAPSTRVPEGKRTLKNLSVTEREATLQRAKVWQPIDTRSLNLAAGPPLPSAQRISEELTCRFVFPEKPLTGNTPKFLCEARPDDVVKVKYGEKNGEVYAEIAASRLFWALGFKADRIYPARVSCQGCPTEPFAASKTDWHLGKPGDVGRYVFDPAAVERTIPGSAIEVPGFEGWAWPELDKVNPRAGGAPRAHVDALKLLAVFVQHSDTKPEQQDLMCAPGGVKRDRAGNETCTSPWLVVKDLGTTFGKATALNNSKMDLSDWSGARIWREGTPCVGDLSRSLTGSLENPRISEAGRKFLASRLLLLGDQQIRALFKAAMAERRDGTVDDWVRVFKRKRDEIVKARCAA